MNNYVFSFRTMEYLKYLYYNKDKTIRKKKGRIYMDFIEKIKSQVKEKNRTIVLVETEDVRTLKAAEIVKKEGFATILLVGEEEKIQALAQTNHIDISGIQILNPKTYENFEDLKITFYELRKEKGMTLEEAKKILLENPLYFANLLVKCGYADGLVAGAVNSSADVLRPALQIIKTAKDSKIVSSFFLMDVPNCEYGANGVFVYSDCGMVQNPTSEELAEIAKCSAKTFKKLVGEEPKVAMLSHSTLGSARHPDVDKVVKAVEIAKKENPTIDLDGEFQLDAAIVPSVAKKKAPNSKVAGHANVLIFPDLDSGNIAYKITERLAHAKAYGPITQGLSKPVNDLSRGCTEEDIAGVVAITAFQCEDEIK